jgi:hypothetical protein
LLFFAIYAWMAGFVGNFVLPKSIDSATAANPWLAAGFDLLLIVPGKGRRPRFSGPFPFGRIASNTATVVG